MAIQAETLAQVKSLIESGKMIPQIKNELSLEETVVEIRQAIIAEYGRDLLVNVNRNRRMNLAGVVNMVDNRIAKMENLTRAEVDVMIANLNTAAGKLNDLKLTLPE